jgi:hypothetical protein
MPARPARRDHAHDRSLGAPKARRHLHAVPDPIDTQTPIQPAADGQPDPAPPDSDTAGRADTIARAVAQMGNLTPEQRHLLSLLLPPHRKAA